MANYESVKDNIKFFDKTYTVSNADATLYYVTASSQCKQDITGGANEILAVTMGDWQANITNKHAASVAYSPSSDSLFVLFEPHTFSNTNIKVRFMYR